MKWLWKFGIMLVLIGIVGPCWAGGKPAAQERTLTVGDAEVSDWNGITTTAVGNPAVVDIAPLSTRHLLVTAKGVGRTSVFVFDHAGKHVLRFTVVPIPDDIDAIAAKVQREIGLSTVTVHAVNQSLFLEGTVASAAASQRAEAIALAYVPKIVDLLAQDEPSVTLSETYAPLLTEGLKPLGLSIRVVDENTIALLGPYVPLTERDPLQQALASLPSGLKIINLTDGRPHAARQVLVRARVIEIDRAAYEKLGVEWGSLNTISQTSAGYVFGFQPQPILFGQSGSHLNNPLTGTGALKRILPFAAQLEALIRENKARILSEPSLVVLDGRDGNLLVGGEIPVPLSEGNYRTGLENLKIDYKPFGIKLDVTPTIVDDHTIQMTITPEVSQLDFADGVSFNGLVTPALTVRRATSTLQMQDGQTLAIGGLYSSTETRQVNRIPLLSKIPILGQLFKSTEKRKEENELLILIETEILKPDSATVQPPLPAGGIRTNSPPRNKPGPETPEP